ncbi:MAG: TerY-C metal binding domain-containing protein [Bacteroidota bacterium]
MRGVPNCPCCGNQFALAICQCQNIFCLDGGGYQKCPHCGLTGNYGQGGGAINIDRQQG